MKRRWLMFKLWLRRFELAIALSTPQNPAQLPVIVRKIEAAELNLILWDMNHEQIRTANDQR